jgi:hypothetical protein
MHRLAASILIASVSCTSANSGAMDGSTSDLAGADLATSAPIDLAGVDFGPCPYVFGTYSVSMMGQGCSDLNPNAPQCIKGTNTACTAHFVSVPASGPGAVNGAAMLMMDGSFSGAMLIFGTQQRSGCVGTWDSSTSTMTVDCGGMGSSQSCVVTLTRTSLTCP